MITCLPKQSRSTFFTKLLVGLLTTGVFLGAPNSAKAATYTVGPTQTLSATVKTLKPGDTLILKGGTYTQQLTLDSGINGTADKPITVQAQSGATVTFDGSKNKSYCVRLAGSHLKLSNVTVTKCHQHGILIQGKHVTVENSTVTQAVQENNVVNHVKWGSGLKVALGAENVTLRNNKVFNNWGEGIAITRGRQVTVSHNEVRDNFSVNLYIDNSSQVKASDNFISCKANSGFERNGRRPLGISLSEEQYDGWGSQLRDLTITNNTVISCHRGISFYSAEVPDAGLRNGNIQHNILWDSQDYGFYLGAFPQTSESRFANNTVQQKDGKLAQVVSTSGIKFYTNTWVNGTPAHELQSLTDVASSTFKPPAN